MWLNLLSWFCGLFLDAAAWLIKQALSFLTANGFARFNAAFPIASQLYGILQTAGIVLASALALWGLGKFFLSQDSDDSPLRIVIMLPVSIVCIYAGNKALMLIYSLIETAYGDIMGKEWTINGSSIVDLAGLAAGFTGLGAGVLTLFKLAYVVIVVTYLGKVFFGCVQRWINLGIMVYTSPLGWATMVTRSSFEIFTKWLSMFFGECFSYLLMAYGLKMAISCFCNIRVADTHLFGETFVEFYRLVIGVAFCKAILSIDGWIKSLGIGTATMRQGNGLMSMMAARTFFGGRGGAGGRGSVWDGKSMASKAVSTITDIGLGNSKARTEALQTGKSPSFGDMFKRRLLGTSGDLVKAGAGQISNGFKSAWNKANPNTRSQTPKPTSSDKAAAKHGASFNSVTKTDKRGNTSTGLEFNGNKNSLVGTAQELASVGTDKETSDALTKAMKGQHVSEKAGSAALAMNARDPQNLAPDEQYTNAVAGKLTAESASDWLKGGKDSDHPLNEMHNAGLEKFKSGLTTLQSQIFADAQDKEVWDEAKPKYEQQLHDNGFTDQEIDGIMDRAQNPGSTSVNDLLGGVKDGGIDKVAADHYAAALDNSIQTNSGILKGFAQVSNVSEMRGGNVSADVTYTPTSGVARTGSFMYSATSNDVSAPQTQVSSMNMGSPFEYDSYRSRVGSFGIREPKKKDDGKDGSK